MKLLGEILHSVKILWFFNSCIFMIFFRTEYDAYRSDLEYYTSAPKTDVNLAKKNETEDTFNRQKLEFERLRSDVQIKLKFLDENRVSYSNLKIFFSNNSIVLFSWWSLFFAGKSDAQAIVTVT